MNRDYTILVPLLLLLLFSLHMNKCERRYYSKQWRQHWMYSGLFPQRIYNMMKEHYEDVSRKMEFIQPIRFTYEESAHYEIGYIMGEILERYRKMVEHLKRSVTFKSDAVFATIKRLQLIEMLYFEIYHLVNMMHEIPRKYGFKDDDLSKPQAEAAATEYPPFDNNQQAYDAQDKLIRDKEEREKNKKKKLKEMEKMRQLMLKGQYHTERTRRPQNKWWPIDYGWEIDYFW